jgi:cation transport regulator ChaB
MREYHSLEEIPEEFREEIRKAREAAMTGQGGNLITVTNTDGKTQTYKSIDELPSEIRALYEQARGQDTSKDT